MNETAKRILKTAGIILLAVILILVIYLLYLVISYHRIEDNLALFELDEKGTAITIAQADNAPSNSCVLFFYDLEVLLVFFVVIVFSVLFAVAFL